MPDTLHAGGRRAASSPSDAPVGFSEILATDFDVGFHDGLAVGSPGDEPR
jgi:hypothetical protein